MMLPKLSVLMPVFNGQRHLPQTLESILNQGFADFELLIVDDGSTDGTFEILEGFAKQDERVQLLRNTVNLGIVPSMNRLFELARGLYVNRHDCDDISLPGRFEQQVAYLDANPDIGMVTSQVEIIDGFGSRLEMTMYSGPTDNDSIQKQLLLRCPICQTSVMFRRHLLEVIGLYDENMVVAQDYDLWLRMSEVTLIARLPAWLCKYRYHSESITHRRSARQYRHTAQALAKTATRRFGMQAPDSLRRQVAHYYAWGAEKFCQSQDFDSAQQCLVDSLISCPDIFFSGEVPVPIPDMSTRLKFADSIFRYVPNIANSDQVRRHFLSNLIMKDVFEAVDRHQTEPIDANLWQALRINPGWLCNRGVVVIAARSAWRLINRVIRGWLIANG